MTLKLATSVLALTLFSPTFASAQNIEVGPGGVRVDGGRREVIERREFDRDRGERRFDRDRGERRFGGRERDCRVTVVRRQNRYGEMVTKRIRECR